jgi:hypothetical protein
MSFVLLYGSCFVAKHLTAFAGPALFLPALKSELLVLTQYKYGVDKCLALY